MRFSFLVWLFLWVGTTLAAEPVLVAEHLQSVTVTIKSGTAEGSGTIFTRDVDGASVNFVWTAAHVIDDLRDVKEVIDPKTGTKRQKVSFKDCAIVKELVEDGRRVGELKMDATVVRYSEEQDLAVLRIRKKNFVQDTVVFYKEDKIPPVGTELLHCGSPGGQKYGAGSVTPGIVSQIGRLIDGEEFDQCTVMASGGSSGGIVAIKETGEYVGMLTRGMNTGDNFNFCIPIRKIREWAEEADVGWALDPNVKVTEEQLKKLPIDDAGVSFESDTPENKEFPYLIRPIGGETKPETME